MPISILPQIAPRVIENLSMSRSQSAWIQTTFFVHTNLDFTLTTQQTLASNDRIKQGSENGMFTGMILIDLQKAFDKMDHEIFLEKMKQFTFYDPAIY